MNREEAFSLARVKQLGKRREITYIYESVSYWDKEKKQPCSKRTLIGRWDPKTESMIPTDGQGKQRNQTKEEIRPQKWPVPVKRTEGPFFGATICWTK